MVVFYKAALPLSSLVEHKLFVAVTLSLIIRSTPCKFVDPTLIFSASEISCFFFLFLRKKCGRWFLSVGLTTDLS